MTTKANPVCFDKRQEQCQAFRSGRCTILSETYPVNKSCPFYKRQISVIFHEDGDFDISKFIRGDK